MSKQSRSLRERAVLIRSFPLGESDRAIVMLTESSGIIRAVAKSARKAGSKLAGKIQPFSISDMSILRTKGMSILTGAETEKVFDNIRNDYRLYIHACCMTECIERSIPEEYNISRLFEALARGLETLDKRPVSPTYLLAAFEFKIAALIGYMPSFRLCSRCGKEIGSMKLSVSAIDGGAVCESCELGIYASGKGCVSIEPSEAIIYRSVLTNTLEDISNYNMEERHSNIMLKISSDLLRHSTGCEIKGHRLVFDNISNSS